MGVAVAVLRRTPGILILFVIVGGLVGGILGEMLLLLSPPGFVKEVFLKAYHVGMIPPFVLDLRLITLTLGFTFRLNLLSLLGIILGFYTYKQS